jgi:serpin B
MTANGADNETLSQMEKVLGNDISLEELNQYLYSYVKSLPSEKKSKLNIADSIWFNDGQNNLTVEKDFLQKNADFYNASILKSAFDDKTLQDINKWVKTNTDGMIDKILDKIDQNTVMYLINAIVFDAEWKTVYNKEDVNKGDFIGAGGIKKAVDFMSSEEQLYLDDGKATGFIKSYFNDKYRFVALLPNEDISIGDYIKTLTGESFLNTVNNASKSAVNATMPKFKYEYSIKMNDALKESGMPDAFSEDNADFQKLGKSPKGNIFIGEVLHKTFISVDELGTKAGAVTKVEMSTTSVRETKSVRLDRPFVYAIIDSSTNLPVFIGTVMNP